jgi:hypothetical protein
MSSRSFHGVPNDRECSLKRGEKFWFTLYFLLYIPKNSPNLARALDSEISLGIMPETMVRPSVW